LPLKVEIDMEEIKNMTDLELASFWNIIQWSKRFGNNHHAEGMVKNELTRRGIKYEAGKRSSQSC